jgi:hypothetical protein
MQEKHVFLARCELAGQSGTGTIPLAYTIFQGLNPGRGLGREKIEQKKEQHLPAANEYI